MKMSKNGWGIISFLIFIVIFIICLIGSAMGFRKLGLLDENYHFVEFSEIKENRERMKQEEAEKKAAEKAKEEVTYDKLEEKMVTAAKKYVKDFYEDKIGDAKLSIKVSVLIDNKYMEILKDSKNRECSGYVTVSKNEDETNTYTPYLKCKKYETKGYESRKDD